MAAATQFSFDLKELTTALIKESGVHEGLWTANFEIVVMVGTFGANVKEAKPGAMMQIQKVQINRQAEGSPEGELAVDAAAVNPAS